MQKQNKIEILEEFKKDLQRVKHEQRKCDDIERAEVLLSDEFYLKERIAELKANIQHHPPL